MRLCPDTFGWTIDAIVRSWGLLAIELRPEAGVYAENVYRVSLEWVPLLVLFGLAAAAGWTRDRLAAEIDRQLGLMTTQPRPEQGLAGAPDPEAGGDAVRFTFGQYQEVTRSATATILLFQIAYWMPNANATHGRRTWLARSARDWCEEPP